jgi:hypothetical protein
MDTGVVFNALNVLNRFLNIFQWTPPPQSAKLQEAEEQIAIDMGGEYEEALNDATQEEIIDLAGKQFY